MQVKHQKGDTTMVAESDVGVVRLYYSVLLTQSAASSVQCGTYIDTTMVAESDVGVVRLYYSVLLTQSAASSVQCGTYIYQDGVFFLPPILQSDFCDKAKNFSIQNWPAHQYCTLHKLSRTGINRLMQLPAILKPRPSCNFSSVIHFLILITIMTQLSQEKKTAYS